MSERTDIEYLADTKEAVLRINSYIQELTFEHFIEDKKPRTP